MLIILAVISINAVFGADGIIASAKKSEMMNTFSTYKEQIKTFNAEKELESEEYELESLTAGRETLIYNTQGENKEGNIQTVIPSMSDEYAGKFEVIKGELLLWASSELEYEIATGMGIKVSPYIIVDGVLLSTNTNLGLQTEDGVVTLPERVTEIGQGAFSGVTGLKEVIIPGTVKVITQDAFSYNTEIEKITIQYGVESIGLYAFKECSSLKEVIIPNSVITIGQEAFTGCSNLTTVQLSENIEALSVALFSGCTKLSTINIPSNLKAIYNNAFVNCSNLNNINIPAGVTSIASSAFTGCTNLKNLTIDEANTSYTIEDGIIYAIDNSTLIMLASVAELETITIREGIQKLDSSALAACKNMRTLNLPSSLNSITGGTFEGLKNLETINFLNGNNSYMAENGYLYSKNGRELVYVVPTKTTINIDENVETIKNGAIRNSNITEFIIPDNVITLESSIFSVTTKLQRIEIGSGVKELSNGFKLGASIPRGLEIIIKDENPNYKVEGNLILTKDGKEVVTYIKQEAQSQIVPEGVEKLQNSAFSRFNNATEIILPSTLKEIGRGAFDNCTKLTEIEIPSSVETIETNAFMNCSNLEVINIEKTQGSIYGSPWGAPKGERSIIWLR